MVGLPALVSLPLARLPRRLGWLCSAASEPVELVTPGRRGPRALRSAAPNWAARLLVSLRASHAGFPKRVGALETCMRGVVARMDEISCTICPRLSSQIGRQKRSAHTKRSRVELITVARRSAELRCDKRETKAPSGNARQQHSPGCRLHTELRAKADAKPCPSPSARRRSRSRK